MKKQIGLLVLLGVLTISCGGKNEKKTDGEAKSDVATAAEAEADCGCDELFWTDTETPDRINSITKENGEKGKPFSGTCADKDENDTIILKKTYKNGHYIYKMEKQKIKGKYFVVTDMIYQDGIEYNGFERKIELTNENIFTHSYLEFKDGKLKNAYVCDITDLGETDCTISVYIGNKNGVSFHGAYSNANDPSHDENNVFPAESRPKCMTGAINPDPNMDNNSGSSFQGWQLQEISRQQLYKIMSELQKELPKFSH